MSSHAVKSQENKAPQDVVTQQKRDDAFSFADQRPETVQLKHLQRLANNSHQVRQLQSLQTMTTDSARQQETLQLQTIVQRKPNETGLPDNLKSGIEGLSGLSMDDVNVHYNSAKPANLQAHAYAQGTDIHIAPGQEEHLPHEAWHVVQQKQGRVRPTMQLKKGIAINDDDGLEKEADMMGAKALQRKPVTAGARLAARMPMTPDIIQRVLSAEQILAIRAQIAAQQAIVEQHRPTVEMYTNNGRVYAGLRRGQLQSLINSLNASIPARESVHRDHQRINEPDPGNHPGWIRTEKRMRTWAIRDHASIRRVAATAWQINPNDNTQERRIPEHWQRENPAWEIRARLMPADGPGGQFQAPRRRRRR
jgi:hypothetical protein